MKFPLGLTFYLYILVLESKNEFSGIRNEFLGIRNEFCGIRIDFLGWVLIGDGGLSVEFGRPAMKKKRRR
jgi:hypothetical protein